MMKCECEHADHFPTEPYGSCVNPVPQAHPYGAWLEKTKPVKTIYGTFNVCEACERHGN
jgi:hypothetical protein